MADSSDAAAKLAIIELAARFENAFDDHDLDAHVATWTSPMSFRSPFGDHDDLDGYREWAQGFMSQTSDMFGGTRHLLTNHEVEVDGDEARMTCYLTIFGRDGAQMGAEGQAVVAATAAFTDDRLRRTENGWRFTHRTLEVDQSFGRA